MSTLVEMLNAWGGRFVDAAWPMLWQSCVLMALVFALDAALRKRVRATTRYALWLLVLVKLLVPTSFSLPTGIAYWLPAPKAVTPARTSVASSLRLDNNQSAAQTLQSDLSSSLRRDPSVATSTTSTPSTAPSSLRPIQSRPTAPTLHLSGAALLLWFAGMATLCAVVAFRARLTRRMILAATATDDYSVLLERCAARLGTRRRVTLKLSGSAPVPAVCALFRPVILLPTALAARLNAAQMEAVLLHELAHVRRGDPWVNYGQALLQVLYFYNPLLWLANAAIRHVREEAVDELVLVALADEAALYPETLLQVAKFSMQTPHPGFGWVGILEKKSTVGGRIRLMLHRPWPQSARLGIRGGLAVLALAAVLLPMKSRPQQENPAPAVTSSPRLNPAPVGNEPAETLPPPADWAPSNSTADDRAQFIEFMEKHQTVITRACNLATTNILRELEALGKKYSPLSEIGPGSLVKAQTADVWDWLSYTKNTHYSRSTEPARRFGQYADIDNGGADLAVLIHRADFALSANSMGPQYPLLLKRGAVQLYLIYHFQLADTNPALEKAVKDTVEKQVGILRKTLQEIIASDSVPQQAQASVSGSSASTAANVPAQDEDFPCTTNDGTITIVGYVGRGGEVIIPGTIHGLPVTSIGRSALLSGGYYDYGGPVPAPQPITSLTIPDSVTVIGAQAFQLSRKMTNVTLGSKVAIIGGSAFADCPELTRVTILSSLTSIENGAFNGCAKLTDIAIPNSVTNMEGYAFGRCASLTSITIPNGVSVIRDGTFQGCASLTNVTIPDGVTKIERYAFGCVSLTRITIPASVREIEDYAFSECPNLTGVYFQGNAPFPAPTNCFSGDNKVTVYYLPGTTGWGASFDFRPAVLLPMKGPAQQKGQVFVPAQSSMPEVNALCAAIYERRWQDASKMIDSGAPVNGVDEKHRTPLGCLVEPWYQWTSEDESPGEAVLQELLQHGADPFAPSTTGNPDEMRTPVEMAMGYADTILGGIMLSNNPSPVRRTPSGDDALRLAIRLSRPFVSKGMTPRQSTLQLIGMAQTRTNLIDFLLSRGFSVNQTNKDGLTALQEMAWHPVDGPFIAANNPPPYFEHTLSTYLPFDNAFARDPILADFLLSRGATLDVFSAAGMGLTNQLAALLRANPKLANARDSFGRTPLHYAVLAQSNTTALLLQAGADPKLQLTRPSPAYLPAFQVGWSPLLLAVWVDNLASAQLLIKAGAPLAEADADGNTPLHSATPSLIGMQKLLISAGAPLDLTNHSGKTPLRLAFDCDDAEDFALLLKAGARKDIGLSNTTLLHLAASPRGDLQDLAPVSADAIIPVLVATGLDVDARDGQGRTPFQLAVTALNLRAMNSLLTNGADINAVDPRGNTALHQLSMRPVDTVQMLQPGYMRAQQVESGPEPTTNINLTAWLLEHGAKPNLTNHDGQTPLDLLRAHKWANADEEKSAAVRIALLQKAGAQFPSTKAQKE